MYQEQKKKKRTSRSRRNRPEENWRQLQIKHIAKRDRQPNRAEKGTVFECGAVSCNVVAVSVPEDSATIRSQIVAALYHQSDGFFPFLFFLSVSRLNNKGLFSDVY